jgi:hypothetical protein
MQEIRPNTSRFHFQLQCHDNFNNLIQNQIYCIYISISFTAFILPVNHTNSNVSFSLSILLRATPRNRWVHQSQKGRTTLNPKSMNLNQQDLIQCGAISRPCLTMHGDAHCWDIIISSQLACECCFGMHLLTPSHLACTRRMTQIWTLYSLLSWSWVFLDW